MNDIRIGTLIDGGDDAPRAIEALLPHGFESFSIMFWRRVEVDLAQLAEAVKRAIGDADVTIDCVSVYGNPLEDDFTADGFAALIDHAHLFGSTVVAGFAGALTGKPVPDSLPRFTEVFAPIAERAADKGVRLAFENCPMEGSWDGAVWNIAINQAAWELMFDALPGEHVGLQWDPSHSLEQLTDPYAELRAWGPKVFHVHGKDASVHWDLIRANGVRGRHFCEHRMPGFGDADWRKVVALLRAGGYTGSIDIEGWHDPAFEGERETTGQVAALRHLREARGGDLVPNPVEDRA